MNLELELDLRESLRADTWTRVTQLARSTGATTAEMSEGSTAVVLGTQ